MSAESSELRAVVATAPGKVNLSLAVGALGDDGYHPLATTFMALTLVEQVEACPAAEITLEYLPGPIDTTGLPTDESNLAIRAARALAEFTGTTQGAALRITKHVPIAGGMGGGSADAAATLVACDRLWGTNLTNEDLLALGAELGSDVPFALLGGVAVGTGHGDSLAPTMASGEFEWVLRLSDEGMSTPATYRALDEHRERHRKHLEFAEVPEVSEAVVLALRGGDVQALAEALENDLQAPALQLRPDLAEVLELGETEGALAGIVSGSGPTLAFLAEDASAAAALERTLQRHGHRVIRTTGPAPGARVIEVE